MVRAAAVAGQFYSGSKASLIKELDGLICPSIMKENAIGMVSPHAGYIYSGAVAASVYSAIKPKSTYIILGPNHTGLGQPFGLSTAKTWATPLGEVVIDEPVARQIKKNSKYVKDDDASHAHEHSIEVQLPFLQATQGHFKFVPIVIAYAQLDVYQEIGRAIAKSIKELGLEGEAAIIASSDLTHYESQESAERKDRVAIDAILALDEKRLVDDVSRLNITMCGYAPVAIMLAAAKDLGAKKARLLKYQTSGDVSGDRSAVVGYAGVLVS